MHQITKKK